MIQTQTVKNQGGYPQIILSSAKGDIGCYFLTHFIKTAYSTKDEYVDSFMQVMTFEVDREKVFGRNGDPLPEAVSLDFGMLEDNFDSKELTEKQVSELKSFLKGGDVDFVTKIQFNSGGNW